MSDTATCRSAVFSADQVQVMHAMGLVPWVQNISATPSASADIAGAKPGVESAFESRGLCRLADTEADALQTGTEHAQLLVVVDAITTGDAPVALNREETGLLALMLRALGLTHADYSVCVLATEPNTSGSSTVADLVTPGRRAVIWLGQQSESDASVAGVTRSATVLEPLVFGSVARTQTL